MKTQSKGGCVGQEATLPVINVEKDSIGRAQLKGHIEQRHESESDYKSQGHEVVYHSIEVKMEVVTCALSSLNKEAARKYKIEEPTIRVWLKLWSVQRLCHARRSETNSMFLTLPSGCDECGSGFSRIQDLNRHKKIHEGYCPFRCNQCKAGFKAEIALRAHKSSIHNDQTMTNSESDVWPFSCNQCESRFQTSTTFGKHMKLLHGVGNPFICDTCGIGLSTNDNLKRHVKVAHSDICLLYTSPSPRDS